MKKLFLLILALCTVLTLAACGEEDHTFATKWENDATDHWHACTDEGCTEVEGKAAHTMASKGVTKPAVGTNAGEETLECSVCGYRQTQPFAALTQEAWNALFAFENVKAVGEMGGSIAEFLINGSAVQLTAENESGFVPRSMVLDYFDLSAKFADFSTYDGKTYKATATTIGIGAIENVEMTVTDGKIVSIIYTPTVEEGEESESCTFTFSEWGTVTVTLPNLTAEAWANAVSSMTLNNYSLDLVTKPAEGDWTFEWFQFNGNEYYHWINYTTDQSGDTVGDNGTQVNAGMTMTPGISALMGLDATKFTVYGDYYVYTESVSNFKGTLSTNTEMGIVLRLNADGQIAEMVVTLSDGSELSYTFKDYGSTTPGSPSYGNMQAPELQGE